MELNFFPYPLFIRRLFYLSQSLASMYLSGPYELNPFREYGRGLLTGENLLFSQSTPIYLSVKFESKETKRVKLSPNSPCHIWIRLGAQSCNKTSCWVAFELGFMGRPYGSSWTWIHHVMSESGWGPKVAIISRVELCSDWVSWVKLQACIN